MIHSTVLKEDLGKAVSLLLELATCPTFPEEEIAVEKGVVIDEIKSYKDSPADDVYDRFEETLFAGHPLGRPILGTAASVRKNQRQRAQAVHQGAFYSFEHGSGRRRRHRGEEDGGQRPQTIRKGV